MEFDHDLDTLGLICPLPVLKARKRLETLKAGQILRLQSDDPAARIDVQHFCADHRHLLLATQQRDSGWHFYIQKAK